VVLVTVGTGTVVGLKAIEVGLGLGFGLLVVAIVGFGWVCTTVPSSGFGGVAGGLAHSGLKEEELIYITIS